jgi:hypothetical protein
VAEVEFTAWTREGHIRHPSYKGMREDKPARQVTECQAAVVQPTHSKARPVTRLTTTPQLLNSLAYAGVHLSHAKHGKLGFARFHRSGDDAHLLGTPSRFNLSWFKP